MECNWYKNRGYIHFDNAISKKQALAYVESESNIVSHSFYPLIRYYATQIKIRKRKTKNNLQTTTKERPIKYASHLDSHIYAYYAQILGSLYEAQLTQHHIHKSVLAFRKLNKSNVDFAKDAFQTISTNQPCSVIGLDISGFFDNLDHKTLKESWRNLTNAPNLPNDHYAIFKAVTRYSSVSKKSLFDKFKISRHNPKSNNRTRICSPSEFRNIIRKNGLIQKNEDNFGIPQGLPISAVLSNIYMLDFDVRVTEKIRKLGGHYFRYCDDMLFITPPEHQNRILSFAENEIKKIKLNINPKKTEIRNFSNNQCTQGGHLQYLGFIFDGKRILLRSASLSRYSYKMRRGVALAGKSRDKANKRRDSLKQKHRDLYSRKLYERYSHLGSRNFITYALRASKKLNSPDIRKQIKPLWGRLDRQMKKT